MDLTKRQQEIFDFIKRYSAKYGYPPTVRDIGKAVGLASSSTVHAHLANLERLGMLRRDPTKPRAIELLDRVRGDVANQRQPGRLDDGADGVGRPVEQLDGPRLGRVAPEQADLLQVRQMGVYRRGGGQADRLADVAHRRRVAVARRVALDEVEDLLLALGQVHEGLPGRRSVGGANMCSGR